MKIKGEKNSLFFLQFILLFSEKEAKLERMKLKFHNLFFFIVLVEKV